MKKYFINLEYIVLNKNSVKTVYDISEDLLLVFVKSLF